METAALPPLAQASAPDLSRRVGFIVASVVALVAASFRNPRLALLVVPLCNRLNRLCHRFARLMDRLAAGRPARRGHSGPGGRRPATRLPSGNLWLVRMLGSQAACAGSQLQALLAEPDVAALLEAVPAAARILRPFGRMLGVRVLPARPPAPRRRPPPRPAPPAPPPQQQQQFPPNTPAWLREHRPSIVLPRALRKPPLIRRPP